MTTSTPAAGASTPKGRSIASIVLLILGAIISILAVVAIWANRQLLNPDKWASTSTKLLQRENVRNATANYLVEQLYANVNVQGEVGNALKALDGSLGVSSTAKQSPAASLLPDTSLDALSGPIAGALRGLAKDGINQALQTSLFQTLWMQANKLADQSLVAVVDGHKGPVGTEQGVVSIDLGQVLSDVTKQVGLGDSIKLPSGAGQVVIMRSNQIKSVQDTGRLLQNLPVPLVLIAFVLYSLAVLLAAKGRRRRMLMGVGLSLAAAGLAVLVIRSVLVSQIPGQLVADASMQPAARDIVDVATSLLTAVANSTWQIGALIIIAAWFAGPSSFAVPVRRFFAPLVRREPWAIFAALFVLLLLAFMWAPLEVTRAPIGMLVMVVGGAIGAELLRRQMLVEFPAVAGAEGHEWFDDAAGRIGGMVRSIKLPKISVSRGGEAHAAASSRPAGGDERDEAPTVESREKSVDEAPTVESRIEDDDESPTVKSQVEDEHDDEPSPAESQVKDDDEPSTGEIEADDGDGSGRER